MRMICHSYGLNDDDDDEDVVEEDYDEDNLPLVRTKATDEKQHKTDADVREHNAKPDVAIERIHEREHARLLLLRLLDHDANAELHERFAEVDDAFSH